MKTSMLVSGALFCFSSLSPALAQVEVPGSADAGRAESSVPTPDFRSSVTPEINIPEVSVEGAPDGADTITFTLNGINLEGVTAYDVAELQQIYADKIGQTVTLTEVYGIAQSLTRQYRNDGYIITQAVIPQQTIDDGVVTIQIVEGFIDQVSLDGSADTFAYQRILSMADNLTKKSPLTAGDLEKWLLLVNDLPGVNARSIISPSQTTIGGADIVIVPVIDPYNFSLNVDNYGSRYLGQVQLSGAAQFNNLFNAADLLEAQFVTDAADDELLFGYTRFSLPVNEYGTILGLDVTHSDTKPGFDLDRFDVEGYSTTYGLDFTHAFMRTRTENLFGKLRFDYRDLSSKNIIDLDKTKDRIAAIRATLDYNVFDSFWRPAVNQFGITLSQGVDVFRTSSKGDANMTRANGDPQFTKLEANMSRLQALSNEWSVLTAFEGQISNNPLLSSEEFGVGGRTFGRGYDSSELVGDDGFAAKVEIQWNPNSEVNWADDVELFGFYDFGKIWNQEETVASIKNRSLASAGLGLRADFTDVFSGEFTVAQPLTKNVDVYGDENPRFFFSLGADF
jgi:hemolysin activation/secretion protein